MTDLDQLRDFFLNDKIYMHCTQWDDEIETSGEEDGLVSTTGSNIDMAFFKKNFSFDIIDNTFNAKIETNPKGILIKELRGKAICKETQKEVLFILHWDSKVSSLFALNFVMSKENIITLFSTHVLHSSNCYIRGSRKEKPHRSNDELDKLLGELSSNERLGIKLIYSFIMRAELSRGHESQPKNPELLTLHLYCRPLFSDNLTNFESALSSLCGWGRGKVFVNNEISFPAEWIRVDSEDEDDNPYYQLLIDAEFVEKNNYFLKLFYIDIDLE